MAAAAPRHLALVPGTHTSYRVTHKPAWAHASEALPYNLDHTPLCTLPPPDVPQALYKQGLGHQGIVRRHADMPQHHWVARPPVIRAIPWWPRPCL